MADIIISDELLETAEPFAQERTYTHMYKLNANTIAKVGDSVKIEHADVMRFVRENTSVPVPMVYQAQLDEESGRGSIVMELIHGVPLDEVWGDLGSDQKEHIIHQLRSYMEELHSLRSTTVGSLGKGRCTDFFFDSENNDLAGPFSSTA